MEKIIEISVLLGSVKYRFLLLFGMVAVAWNSNLKSAVDFLFPLPFPACFLLL